MTNTRTTLALAAFLFYGCESDSSIPSPVDDLPSDPGGNVNPPPTGGPDDPGEEPPPPPEEEVDGGAPMEDGGAPSVAWYQKCQVSDQAFVRKAIMAVLGRRPYSQAEVNLYTDLLKAVEAADGTKPADRDTAPGSDLAHPKQVVLKALFGSPEYQTFWSNLYKDFIRVQRVDEQYNPDCFEAAGTGSPLAAAKFVRDRDPLSKGPDTITMRDVIEGSIALDDITPIYTANVMAMLSLTYAGANAEPAALELNRRQDFGAWFEEVYIHRDTVCLNCHNSEFSVTQTDDPATNRHYPINALLEKSLFDLSTGPATFGGFEGGDRARAPLRYKWVINDCTTRTQTQAAATTAKSAFKPCATKEELLYRCGNGELICKTEYDERNAQSTMPWGWAKGCGFVVKPEFIKADLPGVEAKFGSVTGVRSSQWQLARALRNGFDKLALEGLGTDKEGNVADPDKAFAYLTAMNIAEKVWIQIVGTPLTIPTRFPRNAAARDQLEFLTNTLIDSNFSNQALVEAILASPYVNIAAPSAGCGDAYGMPNIFDPWVIADDNPVRRQNAATDAIVSYPARTASNALYKAMEWTAIDGATFPDSTVLPKNDPLIPLFDKERQFQTETGFYLKNSEPGFRGFDFQARLGWESRFGTCQKIPGFTGTDFIDKLASFASAPDRGTVRDLIIALKDRLLGRATIDELKERPALEALLGTTLDADGNSLSDANASLRKICGVMVSSPQFLLAGLTPKDASVVPPLTPVSASYGALCKQVAAVLPPSLKVTCSAEGSSLSLNASTPR